MVRSTNRFFHLIFFVTLCVVAAGLAGQARSESSASHQQNAAVNAGTSENLLVEIMPTYNRPPMTRRVLAQNGGQNQDYPRQDPQDQRLPPPPAENENTFSVDEIAQAGHRFFGSISIGFAKVIEHTFARAGRPNGYILGEEVGGAFIAGLRYGEGTLHTKDAGKHKVFWQGPSVGYDFGAEGSKTMILVYNLRNTDEIYQTFGGVDGSAYLVGGIGVTFQTRDHITLAPIRSGVGLRLGANIGYLKYTRQPTWNPF